MIEIFFSGQGLLPIGIGIAVVVGVITALVVFFTTDDTILVRIVSGLGMGIAFTVGTFVALFVLWFLIGNLIVLGVVFLFLAALGAAFSQ